MKKYFANFYFLNNTYKCSILFFGIASQTKFCWKNFLFDQLGSNNCIRTIFLSPFCKFQTFPCDMFLKTMSTSLQISLQCLVDIKQLVVNWLNLVHILHLF